MTSAEIASSLGSVKPPEQRGEVLHFAEGFTVVNDTYNSNPDALLSMIKTIVDGGSGAKRKIVVAGDARTWSRFEIDPLRDRQKNRCTRHR